MAGGRDDSAGIREVSRLAGVSVATVSRAIRTPDLVAEATRKRVLEAIEAANYRPNVLARAFRTSRSQAIAVLVPDIANPFFSRVIDGIEKAAQRQKYAVLLGNTRGLLEREREYARMIQTRQVDGLIQLNARIPFGPGDGSGPLVNACEVVGDPAVPKVRLDNVGAAAEMTALLLRLGHRRIAVITGPRHSPLTADRLSGHRRALAAAGVTFDPALTATGDFSLASGHELAGVLLDRPARPTALFCFSDEMAIGALQRIRQAGLSVPGEISVAGFDDVEFAAYSAPPLTTIRQPAEQIGETAFVMLSRLMSGETPAQTEVVLPYELVVRGSTGPAPKA